MRQHPLTGRVAIVTGASSGIGRATAVALARTGARLVLVGRDAQRLADTAARMADATDGLAESLALPLDVRSEADMAEMAQRALDRFGAIDILVHAAGILRAQSQTLRTLAQLPAQEWDDVVDINLRGTFLANRAVLPAMLAARRGDILNLSSKSGHAGIAFDAPYCASKFGVMGLSQALADEARPFGVRVQTLSPGKFDTEVLAQTGPLPQPGDIPPPERVADTIVWMLGMPEDTRLLSPVIEPLQRLGGSGWTGKPEASTTTPRSARPAVATKEQTMSTSFLGGAQDLRGKVVIVTGGTGGIGLATARAAASLGASVVVADIDAARVDSVVTEIAAGGEAACIGVAIDVRREEDHARLVQATLDRFGRIDALISCAGILRKRGTPPKVLVDVSTDEFDDVIGINLRGVFLANRAVLPTMISQRSGMIINLSSVQGLQGRAYDGPYCASKFGVIGLSQAVAEEVRSYGVKVQALMPAAVATPMWEQNLPAPMPSDAVPPERVADLIIFMLLQPEDTILVGPVIAPLGARRRKAAAKPASAE
ncbi:SDR family oxidoreductase [Ideonella sp. BN130291]|uniref:SDR family oxidoreductase n=1 Tax=Ideonella sp. BN130291 TaxID=3112940 RepID=UPI002E253A17|nr:SDR family oxidoreductase [Ideonella sp. BN130291]